MDLLQNLAYMYSITGDAQKSEQYYRKAERFCRRAITKRQEIDPSHDIDTSDVRETLAQILARDPRRR